MTKYNSLNVKLSNSQLNKLKSAIKNGTDVILRLSSNMIGNSDDEASFPDKLLLQILLQIFVKLLLNTHQPILNCQKHNKLKFKKVDF